MSEHKEASFNRIKAYIEQKPNNRIEWYCIVQYYNNVHCDSFMLISYLQVCLFWGCFGEVSGKHPPLVTLANDIIMICIASQPGSQSWLARSQLPPTEKLGNPQFLGIG